MHDSGLRSCLLHDQAPLPSCRETVARYCEACGARRGSGSVYGIYRVLASWHGAAMCNETVRTVT